MIIVLKYSFLSSALEVLLYQLYLGKLTIETLGENPDAEKGCVSGQKEQLDIAITDTKRSVNC